MFTPDVRIEGFTAGEWSELVALAWPPPSGGVHGGLVVVTHHGKLRKLLCTRRGRLDPSGQPWPVPLAELGGRLGARWAVELASGSLEELSDRFGDSLRPGQEWLEQLFTLLAIIQDLERRGEVKLWPVSLAVWPLPSLPLLMRLFDAFCGEGQTILWSVFAEGRLSTCLAARRRGSGFDRVVGPAQLRSDLGLLCGDFTRDYRRLLRAVEGELGGVAMGLHAERVTWQRLRCRVAVGGAWAAAVGSRDLVIDPAPPVLAIALGVDLGRAAFGLARDVATRLAASPWLSAHLPLQPAWSRLRGLGWRDLDLERALGQDLLELLRRLLVRDDRDRGD